MLGVCASLFHMAVVDCLNTKSKRERKWPELSIRKQIEKAFCYSKNKDNLLFSNKLYQYASEMERRGKLLKKIRRCKYLLREDVGQPSKKKYKKIIKKAGGQEGVKDYLDTLKEKLGHAPKLPLKKEWWVLNTNTNKRANFPLESGDVRGLTK